MIKSFAHKGLKKFWQEGSTAGIQVKHKARLRMILERMDDANEVSDMDFHGSGLHPLKGSLKGHWSISVNGNWRITFRFEDGDAYIVNYQDYH